MIGLALAPLSESVLSWSLSVLFQATLLLSVALAIARFLVHQPAARHSVLISTLILLLASPLTATIAQTGGWELISIAVLDRGAAPARTSPSHPESSPSSRVTEPSRLVKTAMKQRPEDSKQSPAPLPTEAPPASADSATSPQPVTRPANRSPKASVGESSVRVLQHIGAAAWWVWLAVALGLLARRLLAWRRLTHIVRCAKPLESIELAQAAAEAAQHFAAPLPPVLGSAHVATPVAAGLRNPRIILPKSIVGRLTRTQLRDVLIHEAAHVVRRDLLIVRLQTLAAIVFWPHPLVCWLNRQIARSREELCDNHVLSATDAPSYSRTLLRLAEWVKERDLALDSVGMFTSHWKLETRVAGILNERRNVVTDLTKQRKAVTCLLALLFAFAAAGTRLTLAQGGDRDTGRRPAAEGEPKQATEDASRPLADRAQPAPWKSDAKPDELAGRAVDAEGEPVEGAVVDAWTWYTGNEATTDAEGRFRLSGLNPKRRVEIRVSKEGYSPAYFPIQPVGVGDFQVTLNDQTYFEGVVRDPDGSPVAGAEVLAKFGPVRADGVVIGDVTTKTKADSEGRFRLYVKPDTYDLQVSADGAGVARRQGVAIKPEEAKTIDFALSPGVKFEAKVVDSVTGEPVEGFVLFTWRDPVVHGKSNQQGRLVIDNLPPGPREFQCGGGKPIERRGMTFYRHGPFGRWWSPQAVHEHERRHIDEQRGGWQRNFDDLTFDLTQDMAPVKIVVERGVTVTGKVTDPEGNPVEGATVAPARTGSGNSITGDTRYSVTTDAEGNYRVVLPASGRAEYNLVAHDGEFEQWRTWANAVSEPMQTEPGQEISELDLTLNRPATVRGRVELEGRAAGEREVRAHAVDKRGNRYYDPETTLRDDGSFELKFIRPGKHYIQVEPFWLSAEEAPEGTSVVVDLAEGEVREGIVLRIAESADPVQPRMTKRNFTVRVVNENGEPVEGAAVGVPTLGSVGTLADTAGQQRADARGQVSLSATNIFSRGISAALVYAVDPSQKRAGIRKLLVDLEDSVVKIPLQDAAATTIEIDRSQLDRLDLSVEPLHLAVQYDGQLLLRRTLETGAERSPEYLLPPGKYRVHVSGPNIATTETEFEISSGQSQRRVEIELSAARLAKLMGKPAPELQKIKAWHNGETVTLQDLRGQVVVLDFWGYWCGPCLAAMPKLMELHDAFADRDVVFLAVHDDSVDSVQALMEHLEPVKKERWNGRDLPFRIAIDGGGPTPIPGEAAITARGATTAAYGITAFPTTLLIDRDGKVAGRLEARNVPRAKQQLESLLSGGGD